jgi:predicted SAM-dependent methyltransferase
MSSERPKLLLGTGPLPIHPYHFKWIDDTWLLIDKYVDDRRVWKMDVGALAFKDNSIGKIYTSHLLEHISHVQVPATLAEWFRVLEPGGTIHINVPDFEWAAKYFLAVEHNPFMRRSKAYPTQESMWKVFYGWQQDEGDYHRAGFTQKTLKKLLIQVGFIGVKVVRTWDAHDIGVLIATASKPFAK